MWEKIKSKLDLHTLEVLIKSSKTILVKITASIVGILISIFLGNNLGSEGLGIYDFAIKFGSILIIFSMFGFKHVIIKFISIAKGKSKNQDIKSAVKTSLIFNGLLSILIAVIGITILSLFLKIWPSIQELYYPLLIVFIMIIPQTISRVYSASLNGIGKIWQANLVDSTLTTILVGLGLLFYWSLKVIISPVNVLLLYGLCRILVVLVVMLLWNKTFKSKARAEFNLRPMIKMAIPMIMVTGMEVVASNTDIIMLGALGTFSEVGIFSVAVRLALLSSFFLIVVNSAIAPKIAHLFKEFKIIEIRLMIQRVSKVLFIIGVLSILLFLFFGKVLLRFWGPEFQEGFVILLILAFGQLSNLATGCAGMLLVMCGFEKIHGFISFFAVILNIILNFIFITNYGALGAAVATFLTLVILNSIKLVIANRKIGILALPKF